MDFGAPFFVNSSFSAFVRLGCVWLVCVCCISDREMVHLDRVACSTAKNDAFSSIGRIVVAVVGCYKFSVVVFHIFFLFLFVLHNSVLLVLFPSDGMRSQK